MIRSDIQRVLRDLDKTENSEVVYVVLLTDSTEEEVSAPCIPKEKLLEYFNRVSMKTSGSLASSKPRESVSQLLFIYHLGIAWNTTTHTSSVLLDWRSIFWMGATALTHVKLTLIMQIESETKQKTGKAVSELVVTTCQHALLHCSIPVYIIGQ